MPTDLAAALASYRASLHPGPAPGARRRIRPLLITALAGAVAVGGAVTMVLPGNPPTTPGRAPGLAAGATPPGPAASLTPTLPTSTATTWRAWSSPLISTLLPTTPTGGPTEPDALRGFAHTGEGALLAAASLHPAIYYTRDPRAWAELAAQAVLWAPGQKAPLERAVTSGAATGEAPVPVVPVGYRVVAATGDRAQFRIWWQWRFPAGPAPTVGALVTVVWRSGDWWLSFDEPAMDMRELTAQDTYTAWSPA